MKKRNYFGWSRAASKGPLVAQGLKMARIKQELQLKRYLFRRRKFLKISKTLLGAGPMTFVRILAFALADPMAFVRILAFALADPMTSGRILLDPLADPITFVRILRSPWRILSPRLLI